MADELLFPELHIGAKSARMSSHHNASAARGNVKNVRLKMINKYSAMQQVSPGTVSFLDYYDTLLYITNESLSHSNFSSVAHITDMLPPR